MARSGQWILSFALLVSAGVLVFGLLSVQHRTAVGQPSKNATLAVPDDSTSAPQPALVEQISEPVPLSEFGEMIMRPLFSPSRRPPEAGGEEMASDTQESTTLPLETNQFLVMGIVIAQDEKVALLKQPGYSDEILQVKEGQKLSDWTVSEITPEFVTIERGGVSEVVRLSDNVLSAAEKQRLLQQAKLKQTAAAIRQKRDNRSAQINSSRRDVRRILRRNIALPQPGTRAPGQPVRTPVR